MKGNPFFILIIIFASILFTRIITAENNSKIIINEIFPDASGSDSGKEWIELFNYSDSAASLSGYYFKVESNSGSIKTITLPQIRIPDNSYFIISEFDFSITNFINLGSGKLGMYNSASKITLYDSNNTKLDELSYPTPAENNAFERRGATCSDVKTNTSGGSVGAANTNYDASCFPDSTNQPVSYTLPPENQETIPPVIQPENEIINLQISEIYPSPNSGEEEWLEIYNASTSSANLANFSLQKPSTTTKTILSGIVAPNSYRLVTADELKFALNNSGDEIMLFSNTNAKLDSLKYKSVAKGISVGKIFDGSKYHSSEYSDTTESPTPSEMNIFADRTIYEIQTISELKKQTITKVYKFKGIVVLDSELADDNSIYLEDDSDSIRINNPNGVEYFAGNKIQVTGRLSNSDTEFYTEDASFEFLNENINPKVHNLNAESDINSYYYRNSSFLGEVRGSYSTSFDVNFAGKTIRVTKLPDIKISKGSSYKITGTLYKDGNINRVISSEIISQNNDETTNEELDQEDSLNGIIIPGEAKEIEQSTINTKIKYLDSGKILGDSSTLDSRNSASLAIILIQIIIVVILFFTLLDIKYVNLWKTKLIYWVRNMKLQSLKDFF